ncbi:MAG TPA: GntR family transcriptional regulator [Pseudonocardiaceae bacterium]
MPNIERPEPPYMQVVRHIREEIVSGRLAEGDSVPSTRQIAADWNVAIATAAKALSTLRSEGLVRGVSGVGTVVTARQSLHRSARDWSLAVVRTGKIYPPGHYARIRSAELVAAPDQVAGVLGIDIDAPVIRRQRTTYDDTDTPVSTSISWFDGTLAGICPDLLVTERIIRGTLGYIEAHTGRVATKGHDQLAASTADSDIASELRVGVGSAVLISRNRWIDASDAVLEYGESTAPPERWAFYEYEIRSETT